MRFSIAGKIYPAADMSRLTMKDMLLFEHQTAECGRRLSWEEVVGWMDEIGALETKAEKENHPEILWVTAVSLWCARRAAGENVTFDQAIDIPAADIKVLPDPEDHKKAAASPKASTRKGTAGAGKRPAATGE